MSKKELKEVGRKIFERMQERIVDEGTKQGKSVEQIAEELNRLRRNLNDKTF